MIPRDRWSDERFSDFQIAHPSFMASFIWMLILSLAAIGATLALSCVTPFAALQWRWCELSAYARPSAS
jgi:hypothetical protein